MKTLFISLDTVCADRLSTFGCTRVSTPNLDALAAEGALFTQAYASDIPTQPSHNAVFTGRFGINTGIVSHFHPPAMLPEEVPWLPSIFQAQGCHTGAVDHLFAMKEWFIRGYEDYMVPPGRSRSPASVINDMAFPWLSEHSEEDFYLFLHYWDAHIPYVPPEPFRWQYARESEKLVDLDVMEQIRSLPTYPLFKRTLYDHLDKVPNLEYIADLHFAEIAHLDHELGRLFAHLADLGILDETLIVVFGDHGEIMTEHDAWFDHAGLYDSVVHVPLMIRAPGRVAPARLDGFVELIDVTPTVLELQGLGEHEAFAGFDGRSLGPLMRGDVTEHRDAVTLSECTWQAKRGIRTKEWKYIRCWDPGVFPRTGCELYDLAADPLEQHDVSAEHPEVVADLDSKLEGWIADNLAGRPDPMTEVVEFGLPAVARLAGIIREDEELERALAEEQASGIEDEAQAG
jgi:arylsulfatase A-like enzyme